MAHCALGESCIWLGERYLKDYAGGARDYISLAFGLISIISWAVAEIPQIFTNFKNGSTEGVSFTFPMKWVVGDLFNLIGCLLEPATLPTQFYTALVYTISTLLLVWQSIYYDHISKWWKERKAKSLPERRTDSGCKEQCQHTDPVNVPESSDYYAEAAKKNDTDDLMKSCNVTPASSLPIPTFSPARERSTGQTLYYMSARSLASSNTTTPGSYLAASSRGSGRSGPTYLLDLSSVDDEELLANNNITSPKSSKSVLLSVGFHTLLIDRVSILILISTVGPNSCSPKFVFSFGNLQVTATVFFVVGFNYFNLRETRTFDSSKIVSTASFVLPGRRILQEASAITLRDSMIGEESTSVVGTCLGWVMAAIYMGGRLPQIWKNEISQTAFLNA